MPNTSDLSAAHTLQDMADALGPPDPDMESALLEGVDDNELVRVGRSVASTHIVTDTRRLYSVAFDVWRSASDAQKETLRGFSDGLLAIGVSHAQKLESMLATHEERGGALSASREEREAAAREAFAGGLALRDQAAKVLRGVAGSDVALVAMVDAAVGTAENGAALAKGLLDLAAAGAKLLGVGGVVAKRATLMRVDGGYVGALGAAGARVGETAERAGAKGGGKAVTQGALDREDGVNALILGHVMGVFEAAHDIDPTIPRLTPIATRRLFGRHKKGKKGGGGGGEPGPK